MILGEDTTPKPVKVLVMAHSGFGKTGGLASLVVAGFKLHIADFDNGHPILMGQLDRKYWPQVEYEVLTDKYKKLGNKILPTTATAWDRGASVIENFILKNNNPEHVVVIDSFTHMGNAAMRQQLNLNQRQGGPVYPADWYAVQKMLEGMLAYLASSEVKCNVVVNCHIRYSGGKMDPEEPDNKKNVQPIKGYPLTQGDGFAPQVGTHFNNTLVGKTFGTGTNAMRKLYTSPVDEIDAKCSAPKQVKSDYPLSTGLADFFAAIRAVPA